MVHKSRDTDLISKCEPCDINYFDRRLVSLSQLPIGRSDDCPNLERCYREGINCTLRAGREVAKYVTEKMAEGWDINDALKHEMLDYARCNGINEKYWTSVNRREFNVINGASQVIRDVERFARVVLLMDPFESVFPECERCEGVILEKAVLESGRDGLTPFSGSGKVRTRIASYCPGCDMEPPDRGTFDETIDF